VKFDLDILPKSRNSNPRNVASSDALPLEAAGRAGRTRLLQRATE